MSRSLQQRWSPAASHSSSPGHAWKSQSIITMAGLLIHCGAVSGFQSHEYLLAMKSRLLIAVPVMIVTLMMNQAADEFGLRPKQAAR